MNSLIRKCFPQQIKLFYSSIRFCYHYDVDTCDGNFAKKHFNNRPENEPTHLKRARLLYQSRKRGMLENDLLLATFAHKYLNDMTQEELETYDHMINTVSNDWDLYYWAVGIKELPDEFKSPIMDKFIVHVKNEKREKRLRQPDLY